MPERKFKKEEIASILKKLEQMDYQHSFKVDNKKINDKLGHRNSFVSKQNSAIEQARYDQEASDYGVSSRLFANARKFTYKGITRGKEDHALINRLAQNVTGLRRLDSNFKNNDKNNDKEEKNQNYTSNVENSLNLSKERVDKISENNRNFITNRTSKRIDKLLNKSFKKREEKFKNLNKRRDKLFEYGKDKALFKNVADELYEKGNIFKNKGEENQQQISARTISKKDAKRLAKLIKKNRLKRENLGLTFHRNALKAKGRLLQSVANIDRGENVGVDAIADVINKRASLSLNKGRNTNILNKKIKAIAKLNKKHNKNKLKLTRLDKKARKLADKATLSASRLNLRGGESRLTNILEHRRQYKKAGLDRGSIFAKKLATKKEHGFKSVLTTIKENRLKKQTKKVLKKKNRKRRRNKGVRGFFFRGGRGIFDFFSNDFLKQLIMQMIRSIVVSAAPVIVPVFLIVVMSLTFLVMCTGGAKIMATSYTADPLAMKRVEMTQKEFADKQQQALLEKLQDTNFSINEYGRRDAEKERGQICIEPNHIFANEGFTFDSHEYQAYLNAMYPIYGQENINTVSGMKKQIKVEVAEREALGLMEKIVKIREEIQVENADYYVDVKRKIRTDKKDKDGNYIFEEVTYKELRKKDIIHKMIVVNKDDVLAEMRKKLDAEDTKENAKNPKIPSQRRGNFEAMLKEKGNAEGLFAPGGKYPFGYGRCVMANGSVKALENKLMQVNPKELDKALKLSDEEAIVKLIGGNAKQAKELINLFKNANVGTRFDNTQCTAGAAQYMLALYPNINPSVFNHLGHGGDWAAQAKRNPNLGISVSRTFKPGDVISMPTGHGGATTVYGHVGAVVDVDKKTGVITIVERNYAGQHFNVRQMQPSEYAGTYALDFSKATRKKKP